MKKTKKLCLLFFILIALAVFLRFYNLGHLSVFTYDQARDALFMKRIILDQKLRLIGMQSSIPGLYTPPFYYYLMLPFLWGFSLNPVGLDFATALFGVATVVLMFFLLKEIGVDWKISLLITTLYAFQPEIVFQSRFAWNPNTTPFFTILAIFSLLKILQNKQVIFFYLLMFFALGMNVNLHYSGLVLWVTFFLVLLLNWQEINKKYLLAGLTVFFLLLSPVLLFDLRHDFINLKGVANYFVLNERNENPSPPFISGLINKYQVLTSLLLPSLISNSIKNLFFFLFAFGLVYQFIKRRQKIFLFFLVIFGLSLFLSSLYRRGFYPFYLTFLYPLPFLLLGGLYFSIKSKLVVNIFLVLTVLVAVNNFYLSFKQISGSSTNLATNLNQVAEFLSNKVEPSFNLVSIYTGPGRFGHNAVDYRYFLETYFGKNALDWEPLDYRSAKNLYLISEIGKVDPLNTGIWEVEMFTPKELKESWVLSDNIYIYHLVK